MYLDPNGNQCAVGCLFSPEDAAKLSRTGNVASLRDSKPDLYAKIDPTGEHMDLLDALQTAHDSSMPRLKGGAMWHWEDHMHGVAVDYKLKYTPEVKA
jgi:hypothetical protein